MCVDPRAEALLNLYVDGELPLDRQAELHAHLAACAACRMQFNVLMAFRLAVRQDVLVLPPAADERFLARLAALRRARTRTRPAARRRRRRRERARRPGLAVAAVAAVVLGAWLATPRPAPRPAPEPEPPSELIIQLPAVTVESGVAPAALHAPRRP